MPCALASLFYPDVTDKRQKALEPNGYGDTKWNKAEIDESEEDIYTDMDEMGTGIVGWRWNAFQCSPFDSCDSIRRQQLTVTHPRTDD